MGRWGAGAACRRRGRPAAGALDTSVPGRYSSLAAAPSPPQAGTSLCTSDRSIMILFLLFFATQEERASNVQCTLCCYMSDLVLCCDGLGGMCRENSFSFGHARPRMKNRPPCAAARCCICLVSCHACGLMCNGACAWRRISTPRSRATLQDREMLK